MVDFSGKIDVNTNEKIITILTCTLWLTKEDMLNAMLHDCIFINSKYYKVPETDLLELLKNKKFGYTTLDLIEI